MASDLQRGGGICGARVVFLPADAEADAEIKVVSGLGIAVLVPLGCLLYALHTAASARRGGPRWLRRAAAAAMLAVLVLAPLLPLAALRANGGPLRSKMAHFALSFFGVVSFFRQLELMCGTGPKGFDKSLKNFVVYFASPAEVQFDEEGRFRAAPPGQLGELTLRIIGHMLVGMVVLSLGRATTFSPFLPGGPDPAALPGFGLPRALPAIYLQATFAYCTLATAMLMHRVPMALVGIDTLEPFRQPLLLATSIRDFWGRRWNLVVHKLMKRTFFSPFLGSPGVGKQLGGFLAFLMSGLFHEYMWILVNYPDTAGFVPGLCTLFFVAQFGLCAAEAALARTPLGARAAALPRPLRTVLTSLAILPLGPLFLTGIRGMAVQCAEQAQTVAVLRPGGGGAALPPSAGGMPPSDWLLAGGAVLVVACLRLRNSRGLRSLRSKVFRGKGKGGCTAVLPVHDSPIMGG